MQDKRLVTVGLLLLSIVSIHYALRPGLSLIFSELDTVEHFLFGFVLSDIANRFSNIVGIQRPLERKLRLDSSKANLLVRLLGFLIVGGVFWELTELLVFPHFGTRPDPFFSLPITLENVDGTIDVTVGTIGCILAWHLAK